MMNIYTIKNKKKKINHRPCMQNNNINNDITWQITTVFCPDTYYKVHDK